MKICIVGGVAGGASAATRLRRLSEDADIVLFEKGDYISYANCGLPYYIGGAIQEKGCPSGYKTGSAPQPLPHRRPDRK